MLKHTFSLLFILLLVSCQPPKNFTKVDFDNLSVIPQPKTLTADQGTEFLLDDQTVIFYGENSQAEAELLAAMIFEKTGLKVESLSKGKAPEGAIVLEEKKLAKEAYELTIGQGQVKISAQAGPGMLHGCQTVVQMLPSGKKHVSLPALTIKDSPRFEHRGLLLDCCRHFWPVEVVKKYIDVLSRYKMNVLHWHLTEDQGWRVEVKKYPRLTEVGACRTEADGSQYCGFYTQEDMREVVEYAAKRHIMVIPEIEMPGHSLAALAAYPHLACTDGPFEVTPEWGVFKDVYCAGSDSTFEFLEDVLIEVMAIFPSEYIHIGVDESPKFRWENCNKCQSRMTAEGLKDEHELQSYFIRRIGKFLEGHGRKLIGWDEILEGGLAEGAMVQSWRGMEGGIEAAKAGNYVVMSPTSHCYLDYGLQKIDLEKIYNFDPVPEELSGDLVGFIKGGECNMWTEHVPDEENLDSKVLPRMIGLAEVLWSYPKERDYDGFVERLGAHYPELQKRFSPGFEKIPIAFETEVTERGLKVRVVKALEGINAQVAFDQEEPGPNSPEWLHDSTFRQNTRVRIRAKQGERVFPDLFELPIAVHDALGRIPETEQQYSKYYPAGGKGGLTDGILGTLDFRDGHWQGFQGEDLAFVIDLAAPQTISHVGLNFFQYNNAWIFAPVQLEISGSQDGIRFSQQVVMKGETSPRKKGEFIVPMVIDLAGRPLENVRFLKVKVTSMGPCPDWHDAAGSDSWLFVDEIVVNPQSMLRD